MLLNALEGRPVGEYQFSSDEYSSMRVSPSDFQVEFGSAGEPSARGREGTSILVRKLLASEFISTLVNAVCFSGFQVVV